MEPNWSNPSEPSGAGRPPDGLTREELLRRAVAGGIALGLPAVLAACGGAGGASESGTSVPAGETGGGADTPKRGGRLRVGLSGGSAETLDANKSTQDVDIARIKNLYDRLAEFDAEGKPHPQLAESFEPNATADVWTVQLRRGVLFHDGKELTADDVVYSLRRNLDPEQGLQGAADLPFLDMNGVKKVDKYTVSLELKTPIGDVMTPLGQKTLNIIPDGFTDFDHPVGTGPFKFVSWTPGQRSLFARNENYWRDSSKPYVDELEILTMAEASARLNALLAGQVDAINQLEAAQARTLEGKSDTKLLAAQSGAWTAMVMAVQRPPFSDVRVRQAFRLIVDREQMIQNVLLGRGALGKDLFSPLDPMYAADLPERTQDLDQARALLKQAGQDGLTVTLETADFAAGALSSAILFAEQAKGAGVNVKINKGPAASYYDDAYLKTPFFQTYWGTRALDPQILQAVDSKAPYNETQWAVAKFDALTAEARGTLDEAKRRELYHEAQKMLYDEGGYIIWGFPDNLDGYRSNVMGFQPSVVRSLGWYGFEEVWLA